MLYVPNNPDSFYHLANNSNMLFLLMNVFGY